VLVVAAVVLVVEVVEVLVVEVLDVEVVVTVVELVEVEVEVVVVEVGVQSGSPGCIVQVQPPALQLSMTDLLHALRAIPDKPAHPASISAVQFFLPHEGGAAVATEETKTPAPSATAANVTTTLLPIVLMVIFGSPLWPFLPLVSAVSAHDHDPPIPPDPVGSRDFFASGGFWAGAPPST